MDFAPNRKGEYVPPEDLLDKNGDDPKVRLTKIVVPTAYDKEQLLMAFEHIHDCSDEEGVNPEFDAVNLLMHIYMNPDLIEVEDGFPA